MRMIVNSVSRAATCRLQSPLRTMTLSILRMTTILLAVVAGAADASADVRQLMQTADYIGVDYAGAVRDGRVADAAEYAEMEEFAALLASGIAQLPPTPGRKTLRVAATALTTAVKRKASPAKITDLTRRISQTLNRWYPVVEVPDQTPSLELGGRLYRVQCAVCSVSRRRRARRWSRGTWPGAGADQLPGSRPCSTAEPVRIVQHHQPRCFRDYHGRLLRTE